MTVSRNRLWLAIALVGVVQSAALGWMVWDRITLLRKGQEVVLEVLPVDPRSLFRGDYVILSYPFSQIPATMLLDQKGLRHGTPVYVAIAREGEAWRPVAAALDRKSLGNEPGRVVLKGRLQQRWFEVVNAPQSRLWLRFGIESYFVPEGKGLELEKMVGQRKLGAVVAVDADGNLAIKGLQIDGKRVYDEPLI